MATKKRTVTRKTASSTKTRRSTRNTKSIDSKRKKVLPGTPNATKKDFRKTVKTAFKNFKERKFLFNLVVWTFVFLVSLVIVDYSVQYLNFHASVAVVNGERIYKSEFYDKLEESYGQTIAGQLIDEVLIYQEASKNNIVIDDADIEKEIKSLEENYGGKEILDGELENRGITRDELKTQIETTLIVQEILGKEIEITEEEKLEFFDQYKDVLLTDNDDPTYEEAEDEVEEVLLEQKIGQKVQPWLTEIRDAANIQNNIDKPKDYEFLRITKAFIYDVIERALPDDSTSEDN